jgi:branched-chain amino acid transport system substrate-binding protein
VAARRLVNLDSVDVIVGPQSSTLAIAAAPIAEESEVLMLVPMASNPAVTAGRRFVFRLAFLDSFQGEVLARFAFDSLGIRRAGVMHDAASPYGRDIATLFATTFADLGGEVVGVERYDVDGSRDYRPLLRRLLSRQPQALLLPNFVSADSVQLRQAIDLGFTGRFLGTDSWDVRGLAATPAYHGALIVGNWDRDTSRLMAQRFQREWKRNYRSTPYATAAATYDAIHIVAEAMRRSGQRAGPVLADTLRHFGPFDGAVAAYDFRGANDPVRGAVLLQLGPDGLGIRTAVPPQAP